MFIDITLFILFTASAAALWYQVSLKIPQLVAIPDQVITERFHEDSAKLRLFILHIKTYYKEGLYKPVFWKFVGKNLYRLHLFLLKFDNWLVRCLKNARAWSEVADIQKITEEENLIVQEEAQVENYWEKVQKHYSIPVIEKPRAGKPRRKVDL